MQLWCNQLWQFVEGGGGGVTHGVISYGRVCWRGGVGGGYAWCKQLWQSLMEEEWWRGRWGGGGGGGGGGLMLFMGLATGPLWLKTSIFLWLFFFFFFFVREFINIWISCPNHCAFFAQILGIPTVFRRRRWVRIDWTFHVHHKMENNDFAVVTCVRVVVFCFERLL